MLSATFGLPRVLVAYHDLVANPKESVAKLHRDLVAAGASDLQLPNDDVIDPTLDRHQSDDEGLLNRSQTEFRESLRSGAALEWTFVPPTHPDTRTLLDTFSRNWPDIAALQDAAQQRSELLDAIFASRSWRLGFGFTRLLRKLVPSREQTADDRWRSLRQKK